MKPRKPIPLALTNVPFTTREGMDAGVGRHRLRGRDLAHPFRGVYAVGSGELHVNDRCRILQARLPLDACFWGPTAAAVLQIPLPWKLEQSRLVHVAVPAPRTAPTGKDIRGHSVRLDPSDVGRWGDLRITTPARTWCDLASRLALAQLVAAGDFLIQWRTPMTTIEQLASAVRTHASRPGRSKLVEALPLLDDRSESPKESELRVVLVKAGLSGLEVNVPITTTDGYRYRADLAFPRRKTIVEFQSRFHDPAINFRADMTRISRLEADGWVVIQINSDDLADPDELVRRVIRVLANRPFFE